MIMDASTTEVLQRCDSCAAERRLALTSLTLGLDHPASAASLDPNGIRLPSCPCGAVETLNRTWDRYPVPSDRSGEPMPLPASAAAEIAHRRLVNAVADHLRGLRRVSPGNQGRVLAETIRPPDLGSLPLSLNAPSGAPNPTQGETS
jgi:hypothetical protein